MTTVTTLEWRATPTDLQNLDAIARGLAAQSPFVSRTKAIRHALAVAAAQVGAQGTHGAAADASTR